MSKVTVTTVTTTCDSCHITTTDASTWFRSNLVLNDNDGTEVNKDLDFCPTCVETKGWPELYKEVGQTIDV